MLLYVTLIVKVFEYCLLHLVRKQIFLSLRDTWYKYGIFSSDLIILLKNNNSLIPKKILFATKDFRFCKINYPIKRFNTISFILLKSTTVSYGRYTLLNNSFFYISETEFATVILNLFWWLERKGLLIN